MNSRSSFRGAPARRVIRALLLVLAFVVPPLAVGAGSLIWKMRQMTVAQPPMHEGLAPETRAPSSGKLLAVILAGHAGTESTDLLAPYEVLAASGEFDVYIVARERRPVPLFPGTLDVLPDFSYATYEQAIGREPHLLVVPYIEASDEEDEALFDWIRSNAGERTTILTICGGSLVLANTGLLDGRRATSHQNVLRMVDESHPQVSWVSGDRWVDDGNIVSSAGITSGIDATLYVVARMVGRDLADRVALELGYPHTQYLDDPRFEVPTAPQFPTQVATLFRWSRNDIGLPLLDGADEMELAAIIDTYPRTFAAQVHVLGQTREVVRSRHGLSLVPRYTLDEAPTLDRYLSLASYDEAAQVTAAAWAGTLGLSAEVLPANGFAYDVALRDMARGESGAFVAGAADGLEYPIPEGIDAADAPLGMTLRPIGIGFIGLLAVLAGARLRRRRDL